MWPLRLSLLAALWCGASCSVIPIEPNSSTGQENPWGMAFGDSPEQARFLAEIIEQVLPVYRELAGFKDRPLRAHLTNEDLRDHLNGLSVEPWIGRAWIAIEAGSSNVPNTVAHELAHFYFHDFQSLFPAVVAEGISDELADSVFRDQPNFDLKLITAAVSYLDRFTIRVSGKAAKESLYYLVQEVSPIEEVLSLTRHQNFSADPRAMASNYGVGWMLVRVIGYDGLVELAQRCRHAGLDRVPIEWLLSAANLAPLNQKNLSMAFGRALGIRNFRHGQSLTITLSG
ncbi:MAG: hypothetical protein CMJ89_08520 [Planctomycetes bacterium]|nr:hypothetical protein [Planctomycetota bacterium]